MTTVPGTDALISLPGGRFVVPGNRWDLLPAEASRPGPAPSVSVIVPYYRDRAELDLVLEALRLQDYPAGRFEVVVADDGSPEPLTLPAGGEPVMRTVRQDDRGFRAAAARNLGASVAEGEILCFLDQDTVPEPGYLRNLTRLPALVPDALTVGRRRHADLESWTPGQVRAWLTGTGPRPPELPAPQWLTDGYLRSQNLLRADDTGYRFVISAVMCCTKDFFAELGGFDETFTSYGGEDWELAYRAWNAGAVLAHVPEAVGWHNGPDWALRGDPEWRRRTKAAEAGNLRRLIPRPESDDEPEGTPADLLVSWTGTEGIDEQALRSGLLALTGCGINLTVHLDPSRSGLDLPRVRSGPIPADSLARARYLVTVEGDHLPTPARLRRLREQFEAGAGRVVDEATGLRAEALRPVHRAARWERHAPGRDLVDELFGTLTT